MTPRWLPDDSQMTPRWLPDDSQMTPRWLLGDSHLNQVEYEALRRRWNTFIRNNMELNWKEKNQLEKKAENKKTMISSARWLSKYLMTSRLLPDDYYIHIWPFYFHSDDSMTTLTFLTSQLQNWHFAQKLTLLIMTSKRQTTKVTYEMRRCAQTKKDFKILRGWIF